MIEKASAELKQRATWSSYWFPTIDKNDRQDQAMSDQISKSWAAFAKTGNPNVSGQPNWQAYSLKADVILKFSQGGNGPVHDLEKARVDYQMQTLRSMFKTD